MANVSWDEVDAAPERINFPPELYICSLVSVDKAVAMTGTSGWKVIFRVESGPYQGKNLPPHSVWTEGTAVKKEGLQFAKRDLKNLGFTDFKTPPTDLPPGLFDVTISRDVTTAMGKVSGFTPR